MKCPHYNKHIKLFYKSKKQNKHPTNNIFLVTHENQRSYVRMSFTFILIQSIRFQKLRKKTFNKKNFKKKYLLQMNRLSIPDEPPSSEQCFWTTWFCSLHQWLCATLVTWHKWCIYQVSVAWKCYSRHWLSIQIKIKHTCWCSWIPGVFHKARQSQVATKISGQA